MTEYKNYVQRSSVFCFNVKALESKLQARFLGIDTRALAVFRMALGALLVTDSLQRYPYLKELLSDAGAQTRISVHQWNPLFGLYYLHGSATWAGILIAITAVVGALLALGYKPRLMAVLGWFLIRCLHERGQALLQGGDILLRFLLIWAAFLPIHAAWCLGKSRKLGSPIPARSVICNVASGALLAQTAIIYISSALTKSVDHWWTFGDLLWWDLQEPWITTYLGTKLLSYSSFLPWLIRSGYILEFAALPLAFFPWKTAMVRTWLVFAMWGFHLLGIGLIFDIGLFPWVSAVSWIIFLPSEFWDRMDRWFTGSSPMALLRQAPPVITHISKFASTLVVIMLLCIVGWNVVWVGLHRMGKSLPIWAGEFIKSVPIHQGWDLFCYPLRADNWLVVVGVTADGKQVNLQRPGYEVQWGVESLPPVALSTYRWRKYLSCISDVGFEEGAKHYADFLCRRWEEQTGVPLVKAELWRVIQYRHPPDGTQPKPTEKNLFYTLNWSGSNNENSSALPTQP